MKLNTKERGGKIAPVNVKMLAEMLQGVPADWPMYGLLAVIADVADSIASGADMYLTFGATKAKDSLVLTVKLNGEGTPVYAEDVAGLSAKCETLL